DAFRRRAAGLLPGLAGVRPELRGGQVARTGRRGVLAVPGGAAGLDALAGDHTGPRSGSADHHPGGLDRASCARRAQRAAADCDDRRGPAFVHPMGWGHRNPGGHWSSRWAARGLSVVRPRSCGREGLRESGMDGSVENQEEELTAGTYPRQWEADVVLSDGGTVHIRPITPDDADRIVAFHGRLSDRTRYFRYFGPYPRMPKRDVERFTHVDYVNRVALVALLGDDIVAVGRYDRLGEQSSAEVAFVVQDDHQGRGLGSILLEHLAAAARERGLRRFVAEVLAENATMVRVFRDAGYQVSRAFEEGVVHLEFDIDLTEKSVAVARAREQAAEARSVHNV